MNQVCIRNDGLETCNPMRIVRIDQYPVACLICLDFMNRVEGQAMCLRFRMRKNIYNENIHEKKDAWKNVYFPLVRNLWTTQRMSLSTIEGEAIKMIIFGNCNTNPLLVTLVAGGRDTHTREGLPSLSWFCLSLYNNITTACPPFSKPLISENSEEPFLLAGWNLSLTCLWLLVIFLCILIASSALCSHEIIRIFAIGKSEVRWGSILWGSCDGRTLHSYGELFPGRQHNCPLQLSCWSFNSINCSTEIKVLPGTFKQTLHNQSPNLTMMGWCCATRCNVEGAVGEWHSSQWVLYNKRDIG